MANRPLPSSQIPVLRLSSPERPEAIAKPLTTPAAEQPPTLSPRTGDSTDRLQVRNDPASPDRGKCRITKSQSKAYAQQLNHLSEHGGWDQLRTSPRTHSEDYAKQKPEPNPDVMRPKSECNVSSHAKLSSFISLGEIGGGGRKRAHSNNSPRNPEQGKIPGVHVSKKQRTGQGEATESSRKSGNIAGNIAANVTASAAPAANKQKYCDELKQHFKELHEQIPGVCDKKCLDQLKHDLKKLTKHLRQGGDASAANQRIDALHTKLTELNTSTNSQPIILSKRALDKLRLLIDTPDQTDAAHSDQATATRKPPPGLSTIGPRKGLIWSPELRSMQSRHSAPAITHEPTPQPLDDTESSLVDSSAGSDISLSPGLDELRDQMRKEYYNDDVEALNSGAQKAIDLLRKEGTPEGGGSELDSSELIDSAEKQRISRKLDEVFNLDLVKKSDVRSPSSGQK